MSMREFGGDAFGLGDRPVVTIDARGLIGLGMREPLGLCRDALGGHQTRLHFSQASRRPIEGVPAEPQSRRGDGDQEPERRQGRQRHKQAL